MERFNESDPVTDAIEEVTYTLTGSPSQPSMPEQTAEDAAEVPPISLSALSRAVNAEARRRYPKNKRLGMRGPLTNIAARLALRAETPYPYSFTEDEHMFPSDNEVFGRIIRRDREAGFKEIHDTIGRQENEHMWLFVPQEGIWIDTTLSAEETTVEADSHLQIFLSQLYPEIEAVHTHPDIAVRNLSQTDRWSFSGNHLLEAARPSTNDIIGHYQMAARIPAGSRQISSIVSHFGVTSFSLLGQPNELGGLRTSSYDMLVTDPSDPIAAIRALLERTSAHTTTFDDVPAMSIDFQPFPQANNT